MESSSSGTAAATAHVSIFKGLFKMDEVTRMISAEAFVVVTSLMLVVRFLLDFLGPWQRGWSVTLYVVTAIEAANYSLVHYTMGLMQLSSGKVNDYFQVWAVLLVTLQYSVKIGRPYGRSKQIPLLDLMSSFWAANLLRVKTFLRLRISLWLIWLLNAARIISYFAASDKAEAINQESTRIVADYMSYEHELGGSGSSQLLPVPSGGDAARGSRSTMDAYRYVVIGEHQQVLKDLQPGRHVPDTEEGQQKRRKYQIRLDPEKLVTVDKVWNVDAGESGLLGGTADQSNQLKDVCLSFALYKLLRCRFYDIPIHEASLPRQGKEAIIRQGKKIRRLVLEYILQDAERAFRVVAAELSFLQDFFYSKHAATFAHGFPAKNLVLSLLLIMATGYVAYPVHCISERMDKVANSSMITHGVLITRVIVTLIVGKELAEIYMYAFSQWTKVLMLCNYVKHRYLRQRLVESAMRTMLLLMTRGRWDEKIRQNNLLISSRAVKLGRHYMTLPNRFPRSIKLEPCTKEAIFESIKRLEKNPERLDLYFTNAFGDPDQYLHRQLLRVVDGLEADTHRILVWHIATCLCEIALDPNGGSTLKHITTPQMPFVKKPKGSGPHGNKHEEPLWWKHYTTSASLSNYCAYLVLQSLVPDNGLVTFKVLGLVSTEITQVTLDGSSGSFLKLRSMQDVFNCLMNTINESKGGEQHTTLGKSDKEEHVDPHDIKNSLTRKGAMLAEQLMHLFGEDRAGLWEKLATFWTGFLLHLAASTRASKHRTSLAGNRELVTHLWALLCHAGYLGRTNHGETLLDPLDRECFNLLDKMEVMDLHGIRDLVASLFNVLNEKTYILFRLEFLVVVVTVLFLAMFIMDIFRRHFHNTIMKALFRLFDAVSDSVLLYLMGAMQTAPFKNDLFPVWALVLVIFRYSIGFISGFGVPDPRGQRLTEFRNVMNLLAAILNLRHGSRFRLPLWSLFSLQILRTLYRLISRDLAFFGVWLGRSSELISEYMRDPSKWKPEECNPGTMDGYRYLVFGERFCKIQKPRYVMCITENKQPKRKPTSSKTIIRSSLITLDKIWGCRRHLLCPGDVPNESGTDKIQEKDLKDLSLAFALSRLLRCRLEDVKLQWNIRCINRNLATVRIIEERDDKRAFEIMELQLNFVNDYLNTRYPMVFWFGLRSLFLSLLQSIVTVGVVLWLSVAIRTVYKPPDGEVVHLVQGLNVDLFITWAFMFFVMFKEIWEMVAYLLSDWTRLLLVCMYASSDDEHVRNHCMERLMLCLFRSKIRAKRWHGHLDQYVFLQSYDDRPKFCNLIHMVTTGMIPKRDDGAKLSGAIDVPECVRSEIMDKLRAILNVKWTGSQDLNEPQDDVHTYLKEPANTDDDRCLPRVIRTLCGCSSDRMDRYGWACFNLQTSSHVILVWHIATSLCGMALAKKQGVDLTKPGFLRSPVSYIKGCCSSKPYLIDVDELVEEKNKKEKCMCSLLSHFTGGCLSKSNEQKQDKLTEELRKKYIIANSLSQYCTYLLVSKPELIPDSFLVPKMVFQETMRNARDDILEGCDSLESRYSRLMLVAESAFQDSSNIKEGGDVVKQGAMLAKELLDYENMEDRWDILAGVWTELLVHIAPTWNAEAHRTCLESGGEFITIIWALLWHCGIEKSNLWPEYDASQYDAPAANQDNGVGNNNINPVEEAQAGEDGTNHRTGTEIHAEDDIGGSEEPEAIQP